MTYAAILPYLGGMEKLNDENTKITSVRLPRSLWARLAEISGEDRRSVPFIIREACEQYAERRAAS